MASTGQVDLASSTASFWSAVNAEPCASPSSPSENTSGAQPVQAPQPTRQDTVTFVTEKKKGTCSAIHLIHFYFSDRNFRSFVELKTRRGELC